MEGNRLINFGVKAFVARNRLPRARKIRSYGRRLAMTKVQSFISNPLAATTNLQHLLRTTSTITHIHTTSTITHENYSALPQPSLTNQRPRRQIDVSTLPQPLLTSILPQPSLTSSLHQPSLISTLPQPSLTPHYLNHHPLHTTSTMTHATLP